MYNLDRLARTRLAVTVSLDSREQITRIDKSVVELMDLKLDIDTNHLNHYRDEQGRVWMTLGRVQVVLVMRPYLDITPRHDTFWECAQIITCYVVDDLGQGLIVGADNPHMFDEGNEQLMESLRRYGWNKVGSISPIWKPHDGGPNPQ